MHVSKQVQTAVTGTAITAALLWPVPAVLELLDGKYTAASLAFAAAYYAGGQVAFWNASFPAFARGYMAGAAVIGVDTYRTLQSVEPALEKDISTAYKWEQKIRSIFGKYNESGSGTS